jgi:integrase
MPIKLTKDIVESEPAPERGATLIYDSEVKGFAVRVFAPTDRHPGGARSFVLNYHIHGTERRYSIGRYPDWSVQDARAEAKLLRKRVDKGEDPTVEKRTRATAPTVGELADRYRQEHLVNKPPKTRHDNGVHLDRHILPFKPTARSPKMGDRLVTEVHSGDIEALHQHITKSGHPVLANRVIATASKMFSLALKSKAGEDKPWRDAALGNPCHGVARNQEEGRERFFSEAEIAAISDALTEFGDVAAANAVRLCMLTGARPAEVLSAKWNQVDEQPGFWIKPSSTTKQRKTHKLALSPAALELFDRMRANRVEGIAWIFPGQKSDAHITHVKNCWNFVRERVGLAGDDRLYDLRHTFASIGAAGGLSLQIIGKLLGHSQARTTQRYAHLADDAMAAAAAKIGGVIDNAGNGNGDHKVRHLGRGQ